MAADDNGPCLICGADVCDHEFNSAINNYPNPRMFFVSTLSSTRFDAWEWPLPMYNGDASVMYLEYILLETWIVFVSKTTRIQSTSTFLGITVVRGFTLWIWFFVVWLGVLGEGLQCGLLLLCIFLFSNMFYTELSWFCFKSYILIPLNHIVAIA